MIAFTYVVVLTHPPEGVGMDVAKIQKKWELNVLGGKKMKIKCEILATFRNNPYLCTVKCMFDYPGRIPRGASLIDNALGARHHDTTPFLKPSPQGMVFLSLICFLKHMEECFSNCHMAHNRKVLLSENHQ
jgi:hypothetical protein